MLGPGGWLARRGLVQEPADDVPQVQARRDLLEDLGCGEDLGARGHLYQRRSASYRWCVEEHREPVSLCRGS